MDARGYLEQVAWAQRRIDALAARRERCRELEALAGSLAGGKAARAALEALEAELTARLEAYPALVRQVEARVDRLEDPLKREVLRMRYLNGWSWKQVAGRTGLSLPWLYQVHSAALTAMNDVIPASQGAPTQS